MFEEHYFAVFVGRANRPAMFKREDFDEMETFVMHAVAAGQVVEILDIAVPR